MDDSTAVMPNGMAKFIQLVRSQAEMAVIQRRRKISSPLPVLGVSTLAMPLTVMQKSK
jgi:hypothetical protein